MCHGMPPGNEKAFACTEGMRMYKYRVGEYGQERERQKYINGLKRFEARGIPILIDGLKPDEEDWEKIFEIREDGSFYMGDYVGMEEGALREIHFDRVYHK